MYLISSVPWTRACLTQLVLRKATSNAREKTLHAVEGFMTTITKEISITKKMISSSTGKACNLLEIRSSKCTCKTKWRAVCIIPMGRYMSELVHRVNELRIRRPYPAKSSSVTVINDFLSHNTHITQHELHSTWPRTWMLTKWKVSIHQCKIWRNS